jgi:membrane-associated phospholipid phosphatase
MRARAIAVLWLLLLATPAAAQDAGIRDVTRWNSGRDAADVISTVLVGVALATPCLLDRTWRCAEHEAVRVSVAVALAELTKHFVHRERPNGRDDKSFYSEHTTIACAATLRTKAWMLCPGVAYLRVAGDEHWTSDTVMGAAVAATITIVW